VDVKARVAPGENLLYKGKADELFPKQEREDLSGEESLDEIIVEVRDFMEVFLWGFASLGDQDMEMGMKVDAVTEGLDDGNDSRHQLMA